MKKFFYILITIIIVSLLIFIVIFAKNNSSLLSLNFIGFELKPYPVWFIILITFVLGAIISFLFCIIKILKLYLSLEDLKKSYNKIKENKE